jgi:dynein heavy chain
MTMKRKAFPRFYFLSNDELIDILANSQDLAIIQQHLKTCFDNIVKLEIVDGETIKGMYSGEGECVPFIKEVKARNAVEVWLEQLQNQMKDTLQKLMKTALLEYQNGQDRKEFVMQNTHYGQIVATIAQIMWTSQTEDAIIGQASNPFSLEDWSGVNVKQLEDLTELVRGDLTELKRKVVVSLITVDVHARDIVDELKADNVSSQSDFRWTKQLKYYWDEEKDDCIIRQVSALLDYGYEYMGACSRLVITPLTDRCWITISNALHIKLGANPSGPAGTGKTESTKDLAKAIAIQCIVFNCSDQVDYIMMGRLFSGLCQ